MIDAGKPLGRTFAEECFAAGLPSTIIYYADGRIDGADDWSVAQKQTLQNVITAHDASTKPAKEIRAEIIKADPGRTEMLDKLETAPLDQIESYVRGKVDADGVTNNAQAIACLKRIESALVIIAKVLALNARE